MLRCNKDAVEVFHKSKISDDSSKMTVVLEKLLPLVKFELSFHLKVFPSTHFNTYAVEVGARNSYFRYIWLSTEIIIGRNELSCPTLDGAFQNESS